MANKSKRMAAGGSTGFGSRASAIAKAPGRAGGIGSQISTMAKAKKAGRAGRMMEGGVAGAPKGMPTKARNARAMPTQAMTHGLSRANAAAAAHSPRFAKGGVAKGMGPKGRGMSIPPGLQKNYDRLKADNPSYSWGSAPTDKAGMMSALKAARSSLGPSGGKGNQPTPTTPASTPAATIPEVTTPTVTEASANPWVDVIKENFRAGGVVRGHGCAQRGFKTSKKMG